MSEAKVEDAPAPAKQDRLAALKELVAPLASLRLTVALLVLSILLVFAGTWAQKDRGLWTVLEVYFRSWFVFVDFWRVYLPGGYLLGTALLANLVAAHALRFQLSWRRSGVILIHLGLVILLVGELITSVFAIEARMQLTEGQPPVSYVSAAREVELALVDPSRPDRDVVLAIPQERLVAGELIRHPLLPCDLRVVTYYKNARAKDRQQAHAGPQADMSFGQSIAIEEVREVTGTGDGVDTPAVLIQGEKDGKPLGTWLGYVGLLPQPFVVGAERWEMALRFRRYYKPWSLQLIDFRHDRYTGSNVPKNFSSKVRLLDPKTPDDPSEVDREVTIAMNEPLRYRGETVYQSGFDPRDERTTILQVVRNPAWTLPYLAVTLGALGMIVHFGLILGRFMRRQKKAAEAAAAAAVASEPSRAMRAFPWVVLGLLSAWLLWGMLLRPAPDHGPWKMEDLARVPVSFQGRVKPLDTVARNAATLIYGSDRIRLASAPGEDKERVEPIAWLLHMIARPEQADTLRTFKVRHPDVLALLGLPREMEEQSAVLQVISGAHPRRYSYAELAPHRQTIWEQARRASEVEARHRDPFQRAILELHGQLMLHDELASLGGIHPIPPLAGAPDWESLEQARSRSAESAAAVQRFLDIVIAYHRNQDGEFNAALERWRTELELEEPAALRAASVEVWYHRVDPFSRARTLFLLCALLVAASWISWKKEGNAWREPLQRGATWLLLGAVVVETLGLVLRVWLSGRPPVTNLYSSALFVGWGVALSGLFLERLYKGGVGTLVGGAVGFGALLVSGGLSGDGDTMAVLQAVLDTNFWLATHVVVITLGYAACFLAGSIGVVALLRGLLTRSLDREASHRLASMTYGTVCFATLFSFVGTILGGIWADQSWGRFWGWDPKENGALLIVLWNAVILHARWGGMVRERGLFLLAIAGNIVVAWSWFGTNMLGVGLHAYGFMEQALFWLLLFMGSQAALIGVGLLPPAVCWRSDPWTKPPVEPQAPDAAPPPPGA